MKLDHVAVAAETLQAGVDWVESVLGVPVGPGGQHARMGTWNRLLSLGPDEYLEVVAIDPEAPPPGRARWFGLDDFSGPPRLVAWIVASDDLVAEALPGAGEVLDMERGAYRWQMAVPGDGRLGFDGLQPAQISWKGPHPAPALEDRGCRLTRLDLRHPRAGDLAEMLSPMADPRLVVGAGAPAMQVEIRTPSGLRVLG
ncbi:VOC family protein [Frigidibacter sp. ROC022]|uniref:VOC family protein n=1 Tax=Frigidibacter sp. ROC022 TaxID=2971796 RepID=UPI00215A31B1|nr:VOC family protein [Frigidibacter sp. ROC022]MCR8722972.1 VOC family protein [Frigidibacter sp. ROC022]